MTVTQTSTEQNTSGEIRCPYCKNVLPMYATFCGACGKQVGQVLAGLHLDTPSVGSENHEDRYRITALVGRRSYVQLFFAIDTLFNRPVTIRDITVSSLNLELQTQVLHAARHEYDLLRRLRIAGLTPVIDFRSSNGHILVVSGWPFPLPEASDISSLPRIHTLEDLLQSGIGFPTELTALSWIYRLCTIISELHHSSMTVGTLDPGCVVLSTPSYTGQPALMVSWLPQAVRSLLTQASIFTNTSHFSAPELQRGQITPSCDVYSLGALLYLLLTGVAPEEQQSWIRTPLQKLRERTPRVARGTEELVLRALSPDPSERFQNADEMSEALQRQVTSIASKKRGHSARGYHSSTGERGVAQNGVEHDEGEAGETLEATISVVPIRAQLARWHLSLQETRDMTHDLQSISAQSQESALKAQSVQQVNAQEVLETHETARSNTGMNERVELAKTEQEAKDRAAEVQSESPPAPESSEEAPTHLIASSEVVTPDATTSPSTTSFDGVDEVNKVDEVDEVASRDTALLSPLVDRPPSLRARITGLIPAFSPKNPTRIPATQADLDATSKPPLLAWLQRFAIGEQRQRTTAAALIETPLRVQPNQSYTIRIHLMGRDAPSTPRGSKKGALSVGLSSLKQDEIVHVEVRSAVYQNYAYIVQRADVHIPGEGFAAEVSIPMQPLSGGQNGRRERLHIFFMDELRQPLYEKPFVIEVFVSHLVQTGREGHNVLTIPL